MFLPDTKYHTEKEKIRNASSGIQRDQPNLPSAVAEEGCNVRESNAPSVGACSTERREVWLWILVSCITGD